MNIAVLIPCTRPQIYETVQYFVSLIEKKPGVTDVRMLERKPIDKPTITSWEEVFSLLEN